MGELQETIDAFLVHCVNVRGLSPHSVRAYEQDLQAFARFVGTTTAISDITPSTILDFVEHCRSAQHLRPRTVKRRVACLKSFFQWLTRSNRLHESPMAELDLVVRTPAALPRALTEAEIRSLIATTRPDPPASDSVPAWRIKYTTTHLSILLLVATGIRVGELTAVTRHDINLSQGCIRIKGKGNRERFVYIVDDGLSSTLRHYVDSHARSFPPDSELLRNARGTLLTPQALRLRLQKAARAAGIERKITPHMLRHTAATTLLEAGVDIRYVQRLLGHRSISTTEIYTHVSDQSLKSALQRADTLRGLLMEV